MIWYDIHKENIHSVLPRNIQWKVWDYYGKV